MIYGKHRVDQSQRRNVYLPALEENLELLARTITDQSCDNKL